MTVNPSHLQAATRVPNGLLEGKKGVQMSFSSWQKGKEGKKKTLNIKLEKVVDSESLQQIKQFSKPEYTTELYRISDIDIQRFKQFRIAHKKNKAVFGDNQEGSFKIGTDHCRSRELSNQPVLVSTWIKVNGRSGLLAFVTDHDLRKEMKKDNQSFDELIPLCDKE